MQRQPSPPSSIPSQPDPDGSLSYRGSVCIAGFTAAGKTTHAHLLAGEFGLTYVSGSQIQLNFMAVSPIQAKDFWLTPEAKAFWDKDQFRRIDDELIRLEGLAEGYIFDTSLMPWRHRRRALCIWLESSLESRVLKSKVSHRGTSRLSLEEYRQRILEKDEATFTLCKELYDIEIGRDLSCFDLILDLSSLIREATLCASLQSISVAHSIIRPAVAWYLTGASSFQHQLETAAHVHQALIRRNTLLPA